MRHGCFPEVKPIDVHQSEAVFPIGIFVVQDIPRVVIAREQPVPVQRDGKGDEVFAELSFFVFVEFFGIGKGRIGEKTTKEIAGMEDTPPIYMYVPDRSSRFDPAASQPQGIPIGSLGFGRAKEGVDETIEQGRACVFLDDHRDALVVRGDDRIAAVAEDAIDREILLRQPSDKLLEACIVRMNDCFYARKSHVFRFHRAKIGGQKPGKRGKTPVCCSAFPGKGIYRVDRNIFSGPLR